MLVLLVSPAYADETVARDAFKRAQELASASPPRWAEACPLFEASYRADPQIGVLLYLADCHEHVGRLASAYAEFNDAAELAQQRGDAREAVARQRAGALAPRLSKVRVVAPASPPPGFAIKRDGVDVTLLVGGELAIDPGDHEIEASAPGYVAWSKKITAAGTAPVVVEIPALDKLPEQAAKRPEGVLDVKSQPDAEILIDGTKQGRGAFSGPLRAGGHTLRVVAPNMRPYQTEITVGDGEHRTIDVPLERVVTATVAAPESRTPVELAASTATGVKLHGDNPLVVALRAELAVRLRNRVDLGLYVEYGQIDTSGSCGFDIAGPEPTTPFDLGTRNQFTKCEYLMPGFSLVVQILPGRRVEPYVGISPGFRFGFADYTPYFGSRMQDSINEFFPAIVSGVRAGVDYHPRANAAWVLGGYVDGSVTVFGKEHSDREDTHSGGTSFLSLFAGVRGGYAF